MKQFMLEHLRAAFPNYAPDAGPTGADLVEPGRQLAIYILNKPATVDWMHRILDENTKVGFYTLFLVDADLLPEEDEWISYRKKNAWVLALHALYYGRIYAYECKERSNPRVFPLHLDYDEINGERFAMYGADLPDFTRLERSQVDCQSQYLKGSFRTAMLGDNAFWKTKRYQQSSSWSSSYSYGTGYTSTKTAHAVAEFVMLGITEDASYEDAKRAYRSKAFEVHPDRHPGQESEYTALMQRLNAAWEYVRDWKGW